MRVRTLAAALATTVLATLVVQDVSAQTVRFGGTVTDTWGNPLEGVAVEAKRQDGGGSTQSAVTDDDGEFQMIGLRSTTYEFTYRLDGYVGTRQIREIRSQVSLGGARRRPAPSELEARGTGQYLRNEADFAAEGGTPSLTLKPDGMFEFVDAEGEGEGSYSIQELSAILIVRDYDGPDDKYTISEPVVVTALTNQFLSFAWGETTLNKQ